MPSSEAARVVSSDPAPESPISLPDEKNISDNEKQLSPVVTELPEEEIIIRSGKDAANHMLSLRDDGDPALTVRSIVLGTLMAGFQAAMNQIYQFKPTSPPAISGSFIVLIIWFMGQAWSFLLPRGDKLEERWRAKNGDQAALPFYIKIAKLINPRPFGLKEHAVAAITASSASNGTASIQVFTVQTLFYANPLTGTTVVLATLSIGLFGYGLTGILRPVTVNAVESVYWTNLPLLSVLQSLHWDRFRLSKPLRWFWYCFFGMAIYEFLPGYIFPWLNSVSIPCLAGMNATGNRASIITNLFGGALSNEGLGILSLTFDWQYITSFATSMPLKQQANSATGFLLCYVAFIAVYYGNGWSAKSYPFLATTLRSADGSKYPSTKVFANGILDTSKLALYGLPHVTGTYAWAMMVGNAAIGALIGHCLIFWRKDIVETIKIAYHGGTEDPHHAAMKQRYKEASWTWYLAILVISFIMGLVVVTKEGITLPWWAYIVALVLGVIIAPFSTILYARYGNGIATNQLMKMLAGILIPGRPLGNLYFSAWSHSVIAQSLNLACDLKLGQYLKVPPRVMFLTQVWGTVFGAFINYVVMISIVDSHRDLLTDTNGTYAWSGQLFQSLNTTASTWALAKYLYTASAQYYLVPLGLVIGFGLVVVHKIFTRFVPKILGIATTEINVAIILLYSGFLAFNQTQACVVLSPFIAGFYVQFYLRNYKPRWFKDYSYLLTAAFDGGSLMVIFILSFAVFGASGKSVPFPTWWGNWSGNPDHCPGSD